jgi:hypothetical protein
VEKRKRLKREGWKKREGRMWRKKVGTTIGQWRKLKEEQQRVRWDEERKEGRKEAC